MTLVIVERSFEQACDIESLQAQENGGAWCLDLHRVRFVRTYVSRDNKRMVCIYDAPDAESVRLAQGTIAMPVDRVWAAACCDGETEEATIVVERSFERPFTTAHLPAARERSAWCFDMHRVQLSRSYISGDGHSVVCTYRAPDVETVRAANRKAELPFDSIWGCSVHYPPG
jgi:hypothetical protein